MGVDSFSRPVVQAIRRLSRADHISVVVGAGASVTANLPDWSLLIRRLLVRPQLPHKTQDDLASVLLQSQGYLLGAEAAFDISMAAKERKRRIARALFRGRSREDFAPRELHFALAELARKRGPEALQVLTTNYDDLLEQAFANSGLPYYSRYDHLDPRPSGAFAIQHLHGFLSREARGRGFVESTDLILSQSDYDRLYLQQNDWPGEAFGQAAAWAVTEAVSYGNRVLREIEKVRDAPESRVPEQPWRYEAAVPVWLGGIEGHPPVIAGALTAATVEDLPPATREEWGRKMEDLADLWQDLLTEFLL